MPFFFLFITAVATWPTVVLPMPGRTWKYLDALNGFLTPLLAPHARVTAAPASLSS